MKAFMGSDFLLENETAVQLFYDYAQPLPLIDYHCHLNARDIWENKSFANLTELMLSDDHYKWRLMRCNGISEDRITGKADDYDKFLAFAETIPQAIGNPVYHWTHMELQKYFGIQNFLCTESAPAIWKAANGLLSDQAHTPRYFIEHSNVYALYTTNDPADSLQYHKLLNRESSLSCKVLPAFRPDLALNIDSSGWREYIAQLSTASNIDITCWDDLTESLYRRMDAFEDIGCNVSDHGMEVVPFRPIGSQQAAVNFKKALDGQMLNAEEIEGYKTELLLWLGRQYSKRCWVMELHMNAMNSCNTRAVSKLGRGTGFDSVCDHPLALKLAGFMNHLEQELALPKMILFSLNDADNLVIASMLNTFQDSLDVSKIQMGPAWWFQDHADGIEKQLRVLANASLLGHFTGMLTDSRSYLAYTRHEYFRRILCNLVGSWVEEGKYPNEPRMLKQIVDQICFSNAKKYFAL